MRLVMSTIEASTFEATSSVDSGLLPDVPPGFDGRGADDTDGCDTGRCARPTGTPIDAPRAMPATAAINGVSRRGPDAGGSTGVVGHGRDSGPWSTVARAFGSAHRWSSQRPSQVSSPGRGKWSDKT